MNWNAIIAICEIIGAIAIVVTLIFLTVQIRQNTLALKSSTWQSMQDSEHQFDQFLGSDPHLCEIHERGSTHGLDCFDKPADRFQYFIILKGLIDLFQTQYYQYENGMIDEEWLNTWTSQYRNDLVKWPGHRDMFRERLPHLRPSFRKFAEDLLKEAEEKAKSDA